MRQVDQARGHPKFVPRPERSARSVAPRAKWPALVAFVHDRVDQGAGDHPSFRFTSEGRRLRAQEARDGGGVLAEAVVGLNIAHGAHRRAGDFQAFSADYRSENASRRGRAVDTCKAVQEGTREWQPNFVADAWGASGSPAKASSGRASPDGHHGQ